MTSLKSSKITKSALISLAVLLPSVAFAQISAHRQTAGRAGPISIELKPLPTAMSATPGVGSAGLGAEVAWGDNATTFADIYAINANLPNRLRNEGREQDVPVIQKMNGYAGDIGARYYGQSVETDSWYGGARMSYTFAKAQWGYQGEKISQTVKTMSPGLEAGYRWIWSNNVLLRLGAGADSNIVQENNATAIDRETTVTADAEDKVKGYAKVAVTPRVDMGIGYAF